jgi:hypothetical protein
VGAELAVAVDHLGPAVEHRGQQPGNVLRVVLQVGVEDHHVVTRRRLGGLAHGGALALVARLHHDGQARVVEAPENLGRRVPAAVVDDDEFDLARVGDVKRLLDRGGHPRFLVVHRHQDGQLDHRRTLPSPPIRQRGAGRANGRAPLPTDHSFAEE